MIAKQRLHSLGRPIHFVIQGPNSNSDELMALAIDELSRIESKFSAYVETSVISQLNRSAGTGAYIPLDAETRSLFNYVKALWSQSNRLFDPTTRIIQDCYGKDGRLSASPSQLQGMLKLVGFKHLDITNEGAQLRQKGMLLNLNSCICAYAADTIRKLLLKHNVSSALIDLGQDISTIGRQEDGANWLVGVRHPQGVRSAIATLKVSNLGFAIRGDYEKRLEIAGEFYGRGLSPIDGQPVPGLLSVVVVSNSCLEACSAASIARLKTEESAINWLQNLGIPWMAIDRELNCHGPLAPHSP